MGEQELLPGVQVDIRSVVREYCQTDRLAYMYFDSIDAGTDPQDVEPPDIWIANNLNGRIQLGEFAAIWGRVEEHGDAVRAALGRIPVEAALWDVDAEILRDAGSLLDVLCGPRAYGARITKILHKKRPDLFPIIDSRVRPLFEDVVPSVDGRLWAEYLVELGRVLKPWIEGNAEILEQARTDAAFGGFAPVTRLPMTSAYGSTRHPAHEHLVESPGGPFRLGIALQPQTWPSPCEFVEPPIHPHQVVVDRRVMIGSVTAHARGHLGSDRALSVRGSLPLHLRQNLM